MNLFNTVVENVGFLNLQLIILIKDKHNSEKHRCKNLIFKLETTVREDVLSIFRFYSKIIINDFNELSFLESLFIKMHKPKLNTGIRAAKELALSSHFRAVS